MNEAVPGFISWLPTEAGMVPRIAPELTSADRLGAWKARWGIGRMNYMVPAGLYAIGAPTPEDQVVVTANYKMSYDIIRSTLRGRNIWLLVLETFGVNVWCAAGKGTFGTEELVKRIEATSLHKAVHHRRLLLPILGAPGVAAHEVARRTGFEIRYVAIRAADLPVYLDNGMATTPAMRELTFYFRERLVLIPVELVIAAKPAGIAGAILFAVAAIISGPAAGLELLLAFLGATLTGLVAAPLLLPWLPGRSFSVKGACAGVTWSALCYGLAGGTWSWPAIAAAFLALPAISAFYALNFTGCTTFTSRSGVKKEMRLAIPLMGIALLVSAVALLAGIFA